MRFPCILTILMTGATLLTGWSAEQEPGPQEPYEEAMAGGKLTPEEAGELEEIVAANPEDLSARSKLLGYYFGKRSISAEAAANHRKNILWIIRNHPEAPIAGTPYGGMDSILDQGGYAEGRKLWLQQAEAHPQNARILGNASQFVLISEQKLAEDLIKKAQKIEPDNADWADRLAHLYSLDAGKDAAAKSLAQFELAQAADKSAMTRFYRLDGLAIAAFKAGDTDKAARYANELLKAASQFPDDWNYGNAIHHGNNVLGLIAFKQDDLKPAAEYLLKAGRTPGSPQLDSFGPNMSLAGALLKKGERDTVLQYLELCRKFWKMDEGRLDVWTKAVKAGQEPDFGGRQAY